jgi:hypothetical protein
VASSGIPHPAIRIVRRHIHPATLLRIERLVEDQAVALRQALLAGAGVV